MNTLACYPDQRGRRRELIELPGEAGSTLVVDRDAVTLCDRRLVAHLDADEPPENARIVCDVYLADPNKRCRRMCPEDLRADGPDGGRAEDPDDERPDDPDGECAQERDDERIVHRGAWSYSLGTVSESRRGTQLCWYRRRVRDDCGRRGFRRVRLRDIVAAFEAYEPVRALTAKALASHAGDSEVAVTQLKEEYERLCASPIVLNRGLREAVTRAVEQGTSLSEIALRCGFLKRDGNGAGERRDELAGAPRRDDARRRRAQADAMGAQRRARLGRACGPRHEPARRRSRLRPRVAAAMTSLDQWTAQPSFGSASDLQASMRP